MKTKEFNLSEKIFNPTKAFLLGLPTLDSLNCIDVKEFIRLLKEKLFSEAIDRKLPLTASSLDRLPLVYINKVIDKLAGDALK
jgi:hypothetical protein